MKNVCRLYPYIIILLVMFNYGCKKDKIPVLATNEITSITSTSAVSGGDITDEGSGTIIMRGVCWSTYSLPTIADNKTEDGPGAGSFTSSITDLSSGTIYYVRAYATNTEGTGYGMSVSFTTGGLTQLEEIKIQNYINNNPTLPFQLKPSGLYYLDQVIGTGSSLVTHDIAYVKYTGKFLDGEVFDTNVGKTDTLVFPVNEGWAILGFNEGITYMKEGGKATLLIPSILAYGPFGYYPVIPGNTPVLFDVDLVKVVKR